MLDVASKWISDARKNDVDQFHPKLNFYNDNGFWRNRLGQNVRNDCDFISCFHIHIDSYIGFARKIYAFPPKVTLSLLFKNSSFF